MVSIPSNTNLSTTGGAAAATTIATVNLAPSHTTTHYVLAAQGDLVNFGPSDYTRCQIVVDGNQIAAVSTIVGDPTATGAQGPAASLSPFSLTGGVDVPRAGATASLNCWHDNSNGATPAVDAGVSLWAHETDSLTLEG